MPGGKTGSKVSFHWGTNHGWLEIIERGLKQGFQIYRSNTGKYMQLVLYVKWILAHAYDYPISFPLEAFPRKRVYRTKSVYNVDWGHIYVSQLECGNEKLEGSLPY